MCHSDINLLKHPCHEKTQQYKPTFPESTLDQTILQLKHDTRSALWPPFEQEELNRCANFDLINDSCSLNSPAGLAPLAFQHASPSSILHRYSHRHPRPHRYEEHQHVARENVLQSFEDCLVEPQHDQDAHNTPPACQTLPMGPQVYVS